MAQKLHTPVRWEYKDGKIVASVTTYFFKSTFMGWYKRETKFAYRDYKNFITAPSFGYFNSQLKSMKIELATKLGGEI